MKVSELIELLEQCPQDLPVMLYYDGGPRLRPDAAYLTDFESWDMEEAEQSVVIGEFSDMYDINGEWLVKP